MEAPTPLEGYHYDENNYKGNLTSIHYPNGTYTTFDYNNRNRMIGLANNGPGGIISQYTYTLDGVGNRINVSAEEPLSWTLPLETIDCSYMDGNFLTSAGTTTYNYDDNGNLYTRTQGGNTTTYTFDSQDRLTNVASPSGTYQYGYDGLFNRVSKTDSGTTTKFLVDPNGFLPQVIAEMDTGGGITNYYVYGGMGLVAKMSGSNVYYYHYDGSANSIAMTDASGNVVNKYAYDGFGNLLNAEEAVSNPFLYVGQYGVMDEGNGLLYMRARYYDPEVGRFINKDPIGYLGGDLNLYAYTTNNPVNLIDPLGLWRRPGHRDLTTTAMTATNAFTAASIATAVNANIDVDRFSNWFNNPDHYMPRTQAAAEQVIETYLNSAIALENARYHDEAMDLLGRGLHTVQDRYAHFEQNASNLRHITGGGECDDPRQHPREFEAARAATERYINQFLQGIGRR